MTEKNKIIRNFPNSGNVPKLRFSEFTEEWEINQLDGYIDVISGVALKSEEISEEKKGIPILRGINITEGFIRHTNEIDRFYSKELNRKTQKYILEIDDLVIGMDGSKVGKNVALIKDKDVGSILIQRVARIKALGSANIHFIFQKIFSNEFIKYVDLVNTSSGIPHISLQQIKDFKTSFPVNILEQEKIASFLTLLDKRIHTQKKIISHLESLMNELREKIFSQQFRFKDDLGNNFPKWESKKIGDIGTFFSGGTPLTSNKSYYKGNIPFIKSGEINSPKTAQFISQEALKKSSAKMVNRGDLIYALYGATSGEVGLAKIDGAINQAILCIRTSLNSSYLLNYLKLKKESILKTYLQGGQGNLSGDIVKSLIIPVPTFDEQTKISNFLSSIDEKIETEKKILTQYEIQKKYLLSNLFV